MIDRYSFGEIVISGKTYRSDVIIYADHVDPQWWRKEGHSLHIDDIQEVISAKPDVIIIGTGNPGFMQVPEKTLAETKKLGIETIVMPTERACEEYNRITKEKKVIACLHLTC